MPAEELTPEDLPYVARPLVAFADTATARAAGGVRIVASPLVPSPWTEAAKGLFELQGIPILIVRFSRDDAELAAWTRADNVPVVFHDDEPPRTNWAAITTLAARLGRVGTHLLPEDLDRRVRTMGLLHEIAGEDGLGWNARLLMIHAGIASGGERGFALPVAKYLGGRYGYAPERIAPARARILEVLAALADRLGGNDFFDGAEPSALDAYNATFLTPFCTITEADCPRMLPAVRRAFAVVHEELGDAVPRALLAHRTRMYQHHLRWPIEL